jgi:flagellar basal body-associated protein FliL
MKNIMKRGYLISMMRVSVFFAVLLAGLWVIALPARAVTISELTVEINAQPGETIERTNQLYDDSLSGVTVYPWVLNFTEDPGREGSAMLIEDPKELKPDREWIKFDSNSIVLPADGTLVDFPYRIVLPRDAEPGTHLISIVYRTRPQPKNTAEGSTVYIGTNVVTSIFLRVAGTTIDQIEAEFFSGTYANKDQTVSLVERNKTFVKKTFFTKPPVDFMLIVNNTGNTHQKPDGNVKLFNDLFGGNYEKLSINRESRIVLPGADRAYEVPSFGQGFMIGKYRARLTLLYGSPLREVTKEISFWIIPIKELLIALLIVILIIVLIWLLLHRRKRKEKEKEKKLREDIMREMGRSAPPDQSPAKSATASGKKTAKIVMIIGVIVVVLGGGGTAAYYFIIRGTTVTNTNNTNINQNTNQATNVRNVDNANKATNTNTAVNTNTLANTNSVVNSAANTNTIVNANTNANTNVNSETNQNSNTNVAPPDTDKDGLSDADEAIYGTDVLDSDTDNDGYLDGAEVQNGYNPKGTGVLNINNTNQ